MTKVFILTEGGKGIGFGHITRCSAIYDAFKENGVEPVLLINADSSVRDLLRGRNYEAFDWLKENDKLLGTVKGSDIVVVDSYLAGYGLYNDISEVTRTPVYIDDNKRMEYPRGVVINGSIRADRLGYPEKDGVDYLLGTEYMPLRREFWDAPAKEISKDAASIMLTFGGDDSRNMTPKVLKLISDNHPGMTKRVIIGKGFKAAAAEEIESVKDGRTVLYHNPDTREMKALMLDSDIAISAAGQTLYELARMGTPTVAVAIVENQLNNAAGWSEAGFIQYAGWWEDEGLPVDLMAAMERLKSKDARSEASKAGRKFVDGRGGLNIVSFLLGKKGKDGNRKQ